MKKWWIALVGIWMISGAQMAWAMELVPDSQDPADTEWNRLELQQALDACAAQGGGVVTIPAGNYYLTPDMENYWISPPTGEPVYQCLVPRSGVTVEGTLDEQGRIATWLRPYGEYVGACNLFYYGSDTNEYIVDADFRDFGIDSAEVHNLGHYNAQGKGFMMAPIKDCDWSHCIVMNTDGTGFGVDEPVNCTISDCTAIACGKKATAQNVGASGFGIGYGMCPEESMVISRCSSYFNRKFGFFFESQARFHADRYPLWEVDGPLVVQDCVAYGNMYNYGGEACVGALFADNAIVTAETVDESWNVNHIETVMNYYFGHNSHDNRIQKGETIRGQEELTCEENGHLPSEIYTVDRYPTVTRPGHKKKTCTKCGEILIETDIPSVENHTFPDVSQGAWYEKAVQTVFAYGVMTGNKTGQFLPKDNIDRASFATMLYKACGQPKTLYQPWFIDVPSGRWYSPSVTWAAQEKLVYGFGDETFRPSDRLTREQACVMLQRFATYRGTETTMSQADLNVKDMAAVSSFAKDAVRWSLSTGLLVGKGGYIAPKDPITRAEMAAMFERFIYKYYE